MGTVQAANKSPNDVWQRPAHGEGRLAVGRIRTIKPEFPHSESMGRVSRDARLLFLMLFTIVDDDGRARAASRMLASLLFPYDDDAPLRIPEWLMELERQNCIVVYCIDGNTYLQITNWTDHQKIDHPTKSKLPAPPEKKKPRERRAKPRENSRELAPDLDHNHNHNQDQGRDRETDPFDEFWSSCPKKVGKGKAEEKYRIAVERGASPQALLAGIQRYAHSRRGEDEKFTLHPATWLHQRRWEDEDSGKVIRPSAFNSAEEIEAQRKLKEAVYGKAAE